MSQAWRNSSTQDTAETYVVMGNTQRWFHMCGGISGWVLVQSAYYQNMAANTAVSAANTAVAIANTAAAVANTAVAIANTLGPCTIMCCDEASTHKERSKASALACRLLRNSCLHAQSHC